MTMATIRSRPVPKAAFLAALVASTIAVSASPVSATTSTFTGSVDAAGTTKQKSHTFQVVSAGTITATLNWANAAANLTLQLWDPGGAFVKSAATSNRPETLSHAATVTGTWKVVAKAVSGATDYTLTVEYPGGSGPPPAIGRWSESFGYKGSAGEYSYGMDYDATDNTILVGDVWNYRIKRYTTGGQFLGVVSKNADRGELGGTGAPFDVEADPDGDVWSADQSNSRIVEFTHNGTWKRTIGSGGGGPGGANYPMGCGGGKMTIPTHMVVHPNTGSAFDGDLYVSDPRCRDVYVFDHDGTYKTDFKWNLPLPGGVNTPIPRGIDYDGGKIYVVEHNSRCIVVFSEEGIQQGTPTCRSDMNDPRGMDIDRANNLLYVVAAYRNEAHRFSINGTAVAWQTKWSSWGSETLDSIRWPAVDSNGNIYIGDTWTHVVRKFSPALAPLAWSQAPQPPPDGGWNQVNGIGIDQASGRLYGVDHFGNRAQAFRTLGNDPATGQPWRCRSKTNCGAFLLAFGGRESVGQDSQGFTNPTELSVGDGSVWADGGHAVIRFDLNGNFEDRFGTHGKGLGQFGNGPLGIRVISDENPATEDGLVYTSDAGMCRLQVFNYAGTLLNHSGSLGCGTSSNSQMNGPHQIDVRQFGSRTLVYVADKGRNRIAVWNASTNPMTYVTAITATYGTKKIAQPRGVRLDPDSNWLYIGDSWGKRVVRINVGSNGTTFTSPQVVSTGADTPQGSFKGPEWMDFGPDGRLFVSDNNQIIYALEITA
jgi:sugar lactone lactonase YvrE